MPFGHKAGLPPSKKYLLMRQPLFGNFDKKLTNRLSVFMEKGHIF